MKRVTANLAPASVTSANREAASMNGLMDSPNSAYWDRESPYQNVRKADSSTLSGGGPTE
jgi:hypothetical protein